VKQYPRFLADMTGDGRADIVGFWKAVWVSYNDGNGNFTEPKILIQDIGQLSRPFLVRFSTLCSLKSKMVPRTWIRVTKLRMVLSGSRRNFVPQHLLLLLLGFAMGDY